MNSTASSWFKKLLLPGFVFQSVVIGGGYGTGREIVEFFMINGPLAGLAGMFIAGCVWSIVLAVSFEFARVTKSYDYRSFFDALLGRFAIIFEIAFLLLMLIILAVLAAATGEIAYERFGVPKVFGAALLLLAIVLIVLSGTRQIERLLSSWSIVLYIVYITILTASLIQFGDRIQHSLLEESAPVSPAHSTGPLEWLTDGVRYAGYNLAVIPALLFLVRHFDTRRDALMGGAIAGVLGIIPAVLFFVAMLAAYPEINLEQVPSNYLVAQLSIAGLSIAFQLLLLGTFVETGAGLLHGVNERLSFACRRQFNREMPKWARAIVPLAFGVVATVAAIYIGLSDLVARGYGILTYLIIGIYVLPLLTLGVFRLTRPSPELGKND